MYAKQVKEMHLPKIEEGGASPRPKESSPLPNRFTRNHERNKSMQVNKTVSKG